MRKDENPDIGYLERIREAEWSIVRSLLPARARILEIGGGSGFLASLMAAHVTYSFSPRKFGMGSSDSQINNGDLGQSAMPDCAVTRSL